MNNIETLSVGSREEFQTVAGELLLSEIRSVLSCQENCVVGLSGGSTPKPIYTWLAEQDGVDWSRVYFYIVDERYISQNESTSNTNMLKSTLLSSGKISSDHLLAPNTDLPLDETINDYQQRLKQLLIEKGNKNQSAHIVTLGLGPDGHIASLFPLLDDKYLPKGEENKYTILHAQTDRFDVRDRVTVSLDHLGLASVCIFFLSGPDKKPIWTSMINDQPDNIKTFPGLHLIQHSSVKAVT